MRRHIRRPSAALVVACVALFVALSGTSLATVAQSVLPANSVGEVQLRDSAVTSAKVADETLQIVDFSPRARPRSRGLADPPVLPVRPVPQVRRDPRADLGYPASRSSRSRPLQMTTI